MESSASLILANARVLTLDPHNPRAEAVAIAGERITAVGSDADVSCHRGPGTEVIDCGGLPLIPGLNDAHTHVLATAASLTALDCRSPRIDSIDELLALMRAKAASLPSGRWIRGYGLEPRHLREDRYPTLRELDSVTPRHPVRLEHSSGHASLLNSLGLVAAGIGAETPDPPDGVIDRDDNGLPTGLLLEMGAWLRERLGRTRSPEEMKAGVSHLSRTLLSYGITSVQDAGPDNGADQWQTFRSLTSTQAFQPRVTMMAGVGKLQEMADAGLGWGSGDDRLRIGHAKIMLTRTTGQLMPAVQDLAELALRAWNLGFPIAIHAIEQEAVEEAIHVVALGSPADAGSAISAARPMGKPQARDRIEHCAECPPQSMEKLARSRAIVVTQPGFIYWRGDGYLERVHSDLLPHLYPYRGMVELKVPVAFGSDSPVIDPNPWPGIYSAISSKTRAGRQFPRSRGEVNPSGESGGGLSLVLALSAHTLAGARAEGMGYRKGTIRPGMLADLALLDRPLEELRGEEILKVRSRLTLVGGRTTWSEVGM